MRINACLPFLTWIMVLILFLGTACGKKDSTPDLNSNSYWTVGNFKYTRDYSTQKTYPDKDDPEFFMWVEVRSLKQGNDLGPFSGSGLWFVFPNHFGTGTFKVTSPAYMAAHPDTKCMRIICNIGLEGDRGAASYLNIEDDGTIEVSMDKDGQYHFRSTKDILLKKHVDLGEGRLDAADTYQLKVNNVY